MKIRTTFFTFVFSIFMGVFTTLPLYGNTFEYLPTSQKVDILLSDIYESVRENDRDLTFEYLKKLILVIYKEKKSSTSDGKRILSDTLWEIYLLAKRVKAGYVIKLKKIINLGTDIFDALQLHFEYKADLFKQKGMKIKEKFFRREKRAVEISGARWGRKRLKSDDETKELTSTFSKLGKNTIRSVGYGFKKFGDTLGHILGADRVDRRKLKGRVRDRNIWE